MSPSIFTWWSNFKKTAPQEKAHILLNVAFEAGILLFLFLAPIPHTSALKYLSLGLAASAWVGKMVLHKRFLWRRTPLDWFWVVFLAVASIASYFALLPDQSWRFFRREFLIWAGLYFLLIHNLENTAQVKRICAVLLLSLTAVSTVGTIDFFRGVGIWKGWRTASILETPGHAAYFALMLLPLSLAAFFFFDSLPKKLLLALSLAAGGSFLLMTLSRGAWLGVMVAALLVGILKDRKFLIFLLAAVLLTGVLLPQILISRQQLYGRGREKFSAVEKDTGFRLYVWRSALNMIKDHPILGIGPGDNNFMAEYPQYMHPQAFPTSRYHNAHNFYLQVAVEMGILGFLAFFSLILATVWAAWKAYRAALVLGEPELAGFLLGILGAFAALGVYGLVSHRFEKEVALYFWTYGALAVYVSRVWVLGLRK